MSIKQRIRKMEKRLGQGSETLIIERVDFGGGPLPPEQRHGNIIIRHVAYESVRARLERGTADEP